jgi:putative DNA primase/helicase
MLLTAEQVEQAKLELSREKSTAQPDLTFYDRAVPMVERGWSVIRLGEKSKIATDAKWQELATTDLAVVDKWDSESMRANCGLVAKPNGNWALDFDDVSVIAQIESETGHKMPETLVVQSSSGKAHYHFKQNDDSRRLGNLNKKSAGGRELYSARVFNRYVLSPFSVHPVTGLAYQIICDAPIIEAPQWLVRWLDAEKVADQKNTSVSDAGAPIVEGGRNNFLCSQAGKLFAMHLSQEHIERILLEINADRCAPPLPDDEVRKVAESISKYGRPKEFHLTLDGKPPELSGPSAATATTAIATPAPLATSKRLSIQTASKVKTRKIQWLWKDRVPLGKLTLFVGVPGSGKSLCAGDVAARLSTGTNWFGEENTFKPSDTLMLVGEDDVDDTTTPRLQAAGADLSKIHFLKSVITDEGKGATPEEREIQFDRDLVQIEDHLKANPEIRLIVVDPVSNYLGSAKMNSEQEVRAVLIPLKNLAERMNVSVIAVMHLNKKSDTSAINRVGGAMAFVGVARAAYLFQASDHALEEGAVNRLQQHFMVLLKCNITKKVDGLVYEIPAKPVRIEGTDEWMPIIKFIGTTTTNADGLLQQKSDNKGRPAESLAVAKAWLQQFLVDGRKPSSEVTKAGKELQNLSASTIERAKVSLKIASEKDGKTWFWSLPKDKDAINLDLQPERS